MPDVTIRQLNEDDAPDFQALRLRALREHPEAFSSTHERESAYTLEFVAERLRQAAASPDNFTLGAHLDDKLIGMVGFVRMARDNEKHRGQLWGMYVASERQGRGIGTALLSDAIARAGALPGLEQIELEVATRNEAARRLYASAGFQPCGVNPRTRILHGEYIDDERMALFLKSLPQSAGEGRDGVRPPQNRP